MRIDQAEGTDYLFFDGGAYRGSMSIMERFPLLMLSTPMF